MPSATQALKASALGRVNTPEPELNTRQGRRNDSEDGVQLVDQEGALSKRFEASLAHIFAKYIEAPFIAQRGVDGLLVSVALVGLN